jgi:hypothetical protein
MSPSARAGAQVESGEPGPRHSLLADIAAQARLRRGPRCSIGEILLTLDEQDAADLRTALTTYTPGAIARALRGRGLLISEGTVARHRRGSCQCQTS